MWSTERKQTDNRRSNICVTGVAGQEKKKANAGKVLKEMMAENIPILANVRNLQIPIAE